MQTGDNEVVKSNLQETEFYVARKKIADIIDLYNCILNDENKLKAYREKGGGWLVLNNKVKFLNEMLEKNINKEDVTHLDNLNFEILTQNAYIERMKIQDIVNYVHKTPLGDAQLPPESKMDVSVENPKIVNFSDFSVDSDSSFFDSRSMPSPNSLKKGEPLFHDNLDHKTDNKASAKNSSSEKSVAKSLLNLAEKSLEIPFLGLPLACIFFVSSKICEAINFIGKKISTPENLGSTAKGYAESFSSASALTFGSYIMSPPRENQPDYGNSL